MNILKVPESNSIVITLIIGGRSVTVIRDIPDLWHSSIGPQSKSSCLMSSLIEACEEWEKTSQKVGEWW